MATRKIKDARDLSTNELIYFKGHAKATYMSDGRNVEEAIHQIGTGGGGEVQKTTEAEITAMGFTKNLGTVTKVKINGSEKTPDSDGMVDLGTIEGGGSSSGGSISYPVVNIGNHIASQEGLNPNTYYQIFEEGGIFSYDLTVVLNEPTDNSVVNEYVFEFSVPDVVRTPSLSFSDTIKWANDAAPVIQKNKTYIISIVNNLAVFAEF